MDLRQRDHQHGGGAKGAIRDKPRGGSKWIECRSEDARAVEDDGLAQNHGLGGRLQEFQLRDLNGRFVDAILSNLWHTNINAVRLHISGALR